MKYIYLALIIFIGGVAKAQNDTIKVKNSNVIYGEIKKIRSRILTIETPYSDDDFTIDFDEVTEIKVQKICFIVLHMISVEHHNKIGPEASAAYNFNESDTTHFSKKGAGAIADLILNELQAIVPELAAYLE